MFNIYVASAIDICPDRAIKQVEEFSKIFSKYKVNVFGAGYNEDSPIIDEDSSLEYKGVISAYDLRVLRNCDIFLMISDLETFCPGTCIEFEYARQLGIYIIVLVTPQKEECLFVWCPQSQRDKCDKRDICKDFEYDVIPKVKNIFIETYADKILYSKDELEYILKDVCGEK